MALASEKEDNEIETLNKQSLICHTQVLLTIKFSDLQVVLLLPDRIEVSINGLGSFLGLSHLNCDVRIAGSRLVLRLKSLCTNNYTKTHTANTSRRIPSLMLRSRRLC